MWFKNSVILIFAALFLNGGAFCQNKPEAKDSTKLYRNIQSYSEKRKFTKFLHQLVFKPVESGNTKSKKVYKKLIQRPYSSFEGKIIRYIKIETLDPFGYSISDTNAVSKNFIAKGGNTLHIKSQHITIRNLLLIRQNQVFDSLLVRESERLVRSQTYVSDVSFYVAGISKKSDSVDIFIRVLDKWSIIPRVSSSKTRLSISISDLNFVGLGHESRNNYTWYHSTKTYSVNANYFIPNIRNTYVTTSVHYEKDEFNNYAKGFSLDRPFFSPFANWAAGINFTQNLRLDSIPTLDTLNIVPRTKFNTQDYWAGIALQIFKGNTEDVRATNLITTARFFKIRFLERPETVIDSMNLFSNEDFYLAGMGISTRKYVQDKYIFNYGITEDVPIGKVFGLTGGYQLLDNTNRIYIGARISLGNYYQWGYISSNFEYGTFLRAGHPEQGVLTAEVNYFTGLVEIGKWKFRQFFKPQIMIGIKRHAYDRLTINDWFGLDDINSTELSGTNRILFTLQTQAYAPWNLIGFRFGPYFVYSAGMLGDVESVFKNSKMYSQFGLGLLIKNEYLVFNTFQLSLLFYPLAPGNRQNVFKVNSIKADDFGFKDFSIGKPSIILYQ